MNKVLTAIVIAQFFCTSVWFASNAVLTDLIKSLHLDLSFVAQVTSAVQLGFIAGTLLYALFTIADRFSPSRVFFISALLAAAFNLGTTLNNIDANTLLLLRFFTGFFLAGIYPVGMKIASDYYQKGLGASLGFLVGALVLGTAFPHLLKSLGTTFPWRSVVYATSVLAMAGGLVIVLGVPDGPYRKKGGAIYANAFLKGFAQKEFRSAAFGYFGHMWELYTFWAFVPVMLAAYQQYYPATTLNVPLLSFAIIAAGSLACIISGRLSLRVPAKKLATIILSLSCLCCLAAPFFLLNASVTLLVVFLFFWGLVVIADSPLFSTLVAQNAPVESRGTALTIVNCIGFSITIISIQLLHYAVDVLGTFSFLLLAPGPLAGLLILKEKQKVAALVS